MSAKNIENITKPDIKYEPTVFGYNVLSDINFNGHCLIKNKFSVPEKLINLYIPNTLGLQLRNLNTDCTLGNCLFKSVKLTKN